MAMISAAGPCGASYVGIAGCASRAARLYKWPKSRGVRLGIPNLITLGRIILVPIVVWAITSGEMRAAFFLFVAAGISDAVDGFLAKRLHMTSELGALIDPLADKALIVSIYVALSIAGALPIPPSGIAEYYSGGYVASDPLHKLFLIAQPESGSGSGSSIQVYNENGDFIESVNGLNFTFNSYLAVLVTIAIDPKTRTGWINGPKVTQLQEFSY